MNMLLVDVNDSASKALSELLGVTQTSKASLLLDHIIPAIERNQCSVEEITETILSVLHNFDLYV